MLVDLMSRSILITALLIAAPGCREGQPPIVRLVVPSTAEGEVTIRDDPNGKVVIGTRGARKVVQIEIEPGSLKGNLKVLGDWHELEVVDETGQAFTVTSGTPEQLLPFQFNIEGRTSEGDLLVRIRRE